MKKPPNEARPQIAALPMRRDEDGKVQILLITSRETQRWIIPKGWPMKGRTNSQAAAQEALEEAGVTGRVRKKPLGKYLYWKRTQVSFELCEVSVYALEVKRQLETWREKDQRQARWFALDEAADRVEEPGLSAIIRGLQSERS